MKLISYTPSLILTLLDTLIMETCSIQKMEKRRFYALLTNTVIAAMMFGSITVLSIISFQVKWLTYLNWIFTLVFIITNWYTGTLLEKIQKDRRLANALNNEIYATYKYKYLATGLYSTLICVFLIFCLNSFFSISIQSYCMIIIFVAVFSSQIHRLILYKP